MRSNFVIQYVQHLIHRVPMISREPQACTFTIWKHALFVGKLNLSKASLGAPVDILLIGERSKFPYLIKHRWVDSIYNHQVRGRWRSHVRALVWPVNGSVSSKGYWTTALCLMELTIASPKTMHGIDWKSRGFISKRNSSVYPGSGITRLRPYRGHDTTKYTWIFHDD